jgi:large subunit ribosomal protein L5
MQVHEMETQLKIKNNVMRNLKIEKIVINIGCGTTTSIEDSKKILENLTKRKIIIIKTKKRTTFNVGKNTPIGCKVTIRKNIDEFLKRMFEAKENKIMQANFDEYGNLAFGIKEYIDIPDMEYDPKLKIIGMDVCVTVERPGYSVKRKKNPRKIGKKHVIAKQESIDFIRDRFNVEIL